MSRYVLFPALLLPALLATCSRPPPAYDSPPRSSTRGDESKAPATQPSLDRSIRVALLRDVPECALSIGEPFDVVGEDGQVLDRLSGGSSLRVAFRSGSIGFPQLGRSFAAHSLDLRPRSGGLVAVRMGESLRSYRGRLRLLRRSESTGMVLNIVDIEDYLPGVVAAEMPPDFERAALRAQAIAARTFAWYEKMYRGPGRTWDVNDDESSQAYGGVEAERKSPGAVKAVADTCGIVSACGSPQGERIFPTYYSSTCGGATRFAPRQETRGLPVLSGDVRCDYCSRSSLYRWPSVRLSKSLISERLREKYPRIAAIGPIARIEIARRTALNRPTWLNVFDAAGRSVPLDIDDFRLAVDPTGRVIKSAYFTPVNHRDAIVFAEGRGYGHGWGMCQYGADGLARAGRNCIEILQYYYPGCRLVRAY